MIHLPCKLLILSNDWSKYFAPLQGLLLGFFQNESARLELGVNGSASRLVVWITGSVFIVRRVRFAGQRQKQTKRPCVSRFVMVNVGNDAFFS
jgi:hypothetical protein